MHRHPLLLITPGTCNRAIVLFLRQDTSFERILVGSRNDFEAAVFIGGCIDGEHNGHVGGLTKLNKCRCILMCRECYVCKSWHVCTYTPWYTTLTTATRQFVVDLFLKQDVFFTVQFLEHLKEAWALDIAGHALMVRRKVFGAAQLGFASLGVGLVILHPLALLVAPFLKCLAELDQFGVFLRRKEVFNKQETIVLVSLELLWSQVVRFHILLLCCHGSCSNRSGFSVLSYFFFAICIYITSSSPPSAEEDPVKLSFFSSLQGPILHTSHGPHVDQIKVLDAGFQQVAVSADIIHIDFVRMDNGTNIYPTLRIISWFSTFFSFF